MPARLALAALSLGLLIQGAAAAVPDYAGLYAAHDFFGLRDALAADPGPDSDTKRFYRAAVLTAFNRPAEANKLIDALLEKNIDTSLMPALLDMRMQDDRRLYDYAGALDAERTLVDLYERTGDDRLTDAKNTVKLLAAIGDAAAQKETRNGDSHILLAGDGKAGWCIPVTVGAGDPCYSLDSGANYSVLIRSEAERLKLKVITAGVEVGSSTAAKVTADVAVAPELLLGNLDYHDVVFLVMPDSAFTFRDFQIRGLLGYPVLAGMGAVTTGRDHGLDVPRDVPTKRVDDIALDGNDILIQVHMGGHALLCRLDTGAERTVFYKPYYDAFKDWVQKKGTAQTTHTGGAGGMQSYPSYQLKAVKLSVAGRAVTLDQADVYTEDVSSRDYLMCNLGQDVLRNFKSYTINLESMGFTLDK